jgi:hypothetical protein
MEALSELGLGQLGAVFVLTAARSSSGDGVLELHGAAAATVFLAGTPRRELGQLATQRFVELWDDEDAFAAAPPRAVLSFVDEGDGAPADVTVVLHEPRLEGDALAFRVEAEELPARSGPCALFVGGRGLRRPR